MGQKLSSGKPQDARLSYSGRVDIARALADEGGYSTSFSYRQFLPSRPQTMTAEPNPDFISSSGASTNDNIYPLLEEGTVARPVSEVDVIFLHDIYQSCAVTWATRDSPENIWLLSRLPSDVLKNIRGFYFDHPPPIGTGPVQITLKEILSTSRLTEPAEILLDEIKKKWERNRPIFFIAHGLGGLVLEQALVKLGKDDTDGLLRDIHGIILFGTPHFRAGLAEWALLSAKELGAPYKGTLQQQDWSGCEENIEDIVDMQKTFYDMYMDRSRSSYAEGIDMVCCYAMEGIYEADRITPEWAVIPYFRMFGIPADHFGMTHFETEAVPTTLSRWIYDLEKNTLKHRFNWMADTAYQERYRKIDPTPVKTGEKIWQPKQLSTTYRFWRGENPFYLMPCHDPNMESQPFDTQDALLTWGTRRPDGHLTRPVNPSLLELSGVKESSLSYDELEWSGYRRPLRWQLEVLEEWGRHVRMRSVERGEGENPDREHYQFRYLKAYSRQLDRDGGRRERDVYLDAARKYGEVAQVYVVVEALVVKGSLGCPDNEYVFAFKVEELSANKKA